MTQGNVIEGVYIGNRFNLEKLFGKVFADYSDQVRLRHPHEIEDPEAIRFALAWHPDDDAFTPYPNLSLVSSIAAGVDSLVSCPSLPQTAHVTRIRDEAQADLMAGFAVWQVIWHHRNMGQYIRQQSTPKWWQHPLDTPPKDYTVGILGYGLMGKAIARAITAAGFPVVAAVRTSKTNDADSEIGVRFETGAGAIQRVAAQSQVLINVLPLTPETENILNADLFNQMPHGARLIQLGRGQQLVDNDLDTAISTGQIGGASLDVFRKEPLPEDHPWWSNEKILITPHQASDSSRALVAQQVTAAAIETVAGRVPPNTVDRNQGY